MKNGEGVPEKNLPPLQHTWSFFMNFHCSRITSYIFASLFLLSQLRFFGFWEFSWAGLPAFITEWAVVAARLLDLLFGLIIMGLYRPGFSNYRVEQIPIINEVDARFGQKKENQIYTPHLVKNVRLNQDVFYGNSGKPHKKVFFKKV